MTASPRIERLRELMRQRGMQVYLIPGTDPHRSEYTPDTWARRRWISGFTGSNGDVAVSLAEAGLWTDSRYFLQAERELAGSGISMFRLGEAGEPELYEWIAERAADAAGVDRSLLSEAAAGELRAQVESRGARLLETDENLVDLIWKDRPDIPAAPVTPYPPEYAGESVAGKLSRLRGLMSRQGAEVLVLSALDSIAWLFNLRGGDVAFTPVAVAYATVEEDAAHLFLHAGKATPELGAALDGLVALHDYREFGEHLRGTAAQGRAVWVDPREGSRRVISLLDGAGRVIRRRNPVPLMKAVKNHVELQGFRAANRRDGAAMVRFLRWLEHTVEKSRPSELQIAEQLEMFRAQDPLYRGPSFAAIVGYGPHAAVVHYRATPESSAKLDRCGVVLIDSGGQYLDGTTDITRTVALGDPEEEVRRNFTLVLEGHLRLAATRFPEGTRGAALDTIARLPLWRCGLDYGHGTGHGIGSYLGVHEGPHAISATSGHEVALEPGMLVSIEPGYYEAGRYGLRVENLAIVIADEETADRSRRFLKLENVTLCPIDRRLVDPGLLGAEVRGLLDDYHRRVREALTPLLGGEDSDWLAAATQAL